MSMEDVRIRRAAVEDCTAIAEIYRPHVETGIASFEEVAPDSAEIAKRMAAAGAAYPWLVADADGEVIGYAYASQHKARAAYRFSVDTTIYLAADAIGKGMGRSLYAALLDLLTQQNYVMAFGGMTEPNEASTGLHRAMGFSPVARYPSVGYKQGAWRDVEWWSRPLAAPQTPPAPLLSLNEITECPA